MRKAESLALTLHLLSIERLAHDGQLSSAGCNRLSRPFERDIACFAPKTRLSFLLPNPRPNLCLVSDRHGRRYLEYVASAGCALNLRATS